MTSSVRVKKQGHQEARGARRAEASGIGLALAGGGFLGAAYELGVLAALAESIDGLHMNRLDAYVGVSVGSFIAAGLANGLSPYQLVRMFIDSEDTETSFEPTELMRPAYRELRQAIRRTPQAAWQGLNAAGRQLTSGPGPMFWRAIEQAQAALPTGLVSSETARKKLARLLVRLGGTDDFRELGTILRIVATDVDNGLPVEFGSKGFDHVPISRAVAASSAVPGLFAPVRIDGRHFVDGALNKTLHASVAFDAGARLVICVNPLVPYGAAAAKALEPRARDGCPSELAPTPHRSLGALLSQSVRTAIRSRMTVGLEKYSITYPDADILLFEPGADDARMFSASIFSLSKRRQLCEHAYQRTREDLRRRSAQIDPVLRRHGLRLNLAVLHETNLSLLPGLPRTEPARPKSLEATMNRLRHVLEDLDRTLYLSRLSQGR